MKLAFLILVHRHADLARQLCRTLLSYEHSTVYIHVDLKSEAVHDDLRAEFAGNKRVRLITERYRVHWGSQAQIKATLALMRAASAEDFGYACLLSGQDLPVRAVKEFAAFLQQNDGKQFMSYFALPASHWDQGGLERMQFFHVDGLRESWKLNKLEGLIGRVHRLTGYRRPLPSLPLYGGANWFNLSSEAVRFVLKYVDDHPAYLRRFRWTLTADEIFVQTILLNSVFASKVISDDLRFIDWSTGPEYPRIWRMEDASRLLASPDRFFARKFDPDVDPEIIRFITAHVS